jgi:RNA polymerase sigma-70 factor (ECF subfamily)
MHDSHEDFEELMRRVRQGCPGAAREVYDRYNPHVQRIVRRYLARRLRKQYDSLDFLQEVWTSFFMTPADRYTFDRPADLINFLGRVATNKVVEAYRQRVQTAKHDIARELPIARLPADDGTIQKSAVAAEPPGREPTPSQLTIAEERWELMLRGQPPRSRRVLELLRQGHTYREVSEQTGIHHKVIQRLVRKLGERVDAG